MSKLITKQDDAYLHASTREVIQAIGLLLLHGAVTLGVLYIISSYLLEISFLIWSTISVVFASTMLSYVIWMALKWLWSRITINDQRYTFTGKVYPILGIVLVIASIIVGAEFAIGAVILMLMSAFYEWWHLAIIAGLLVLMAISLIITIRYMKGWVHKHVVPEQTKERIE